MGVFNLIFISFIPLILYFTKVEHWGSLSSLPWGYLCGLAGLWLGEWTQLWDTHTHAYRKDILVNNIISLPVFNILVNVGVVLTYPILISIGTLLSVPGNAGMCLCVCVCACVRASVCG
jgi:solute carrier family 35 protein F3/4